MADIRINYLEFASKDLAATKLFFREVFNWQFTDYGPDYVAFEKSAGLDGGFYASESVSQTSNGAPLVVFHAADLNAIEKTIVDHGGIILKPIFEFPGGKRFQFQEPGGNEFAVWSEQ
jgi:hypothetical protein